ncbi:hypothetical protein NPX13_g6800 [Xylaria arbuscula]|uniref:Heterokaryon incompatibility domain-containing protein n=1 Tax=Xylaria arbuscula TaxID=114810 RepID=A0A9W8NB67_9PEZI|nr:hypothetical protein NPX13_g6800 [Xylaria arbuscula]
MQVQGCGGSRRQKCIKVQNGSPVAKGLPIQLGHLRSVSRGASREGKKMRLLNAETFETEDFFDGQIPPYTILSHTWGHEKDEIIFHDIKTGRIKDAATRPAKLMGCCERTRKDGYKYTWIDTCCIDKTSAVELGEAINSMFRWYTNASICYAYLLDVPPSGTVDDTNFAMSSSRWFTRGWTLQELLAPKELRFFCSTWSSLGTKSDLATTIEQITSISRPFLLGAVPLSQARVAQRMAWASKRVTKRKEDMAYCLLGIFNVTMPMIYGEGEQSFFRLQQAIIAHTDDDSILAWGFKLGNVASVDVSKDRISGIFASKPADFAHCAHVVSPQGSRASLEISGGRLPLHTTSRGKTYCLLNCRLESSPGLRTLGVPLTLNSGGDFIKEYFRPQGRAPISFPTTIKSRTEQIEILMGHRRNAEMVPNRQNWFYIDDSSQIGLNLIEVHPRQRWQKNQSIITTDDPNDDGISGIQQTLVRLRSNKHSTSDFIMLLEFDAHKSIDGEARCYAMICSKDTTLESLSQALYHIRPKMDGKQDANNGILNLRVFVNREGVEGQLMFKVQFKLMPQPPVKTIDATEELKLIELHWRGTKSWFSRVSSGAKKSDELRQYSHRIQELEATIKDLRQRNTELANKLLVSEQRDDHEAEVEELEATIGDLQRQNAELADKLLNAGGSNNKEAKVEVPGNGLTEPTTEDIDNGLSVPTGAISRKGPAAYLPFLFYRTAQPVIINKKQDGDKSRQHFQSLIEKGQFEKMLGYRTPYNFPAIFSLDGQLAAVDPGDPVLLRKHDQEGQVHIWKSNRTGRLELFQRVELSGINRKPAGWSPDGQVLATYDLDKHRMYLFRSDPEGRFEMAQELEILTSYEFSYNPGKAIFSPKNDRLVVIVPSSRSYSGEKYSGLQIWEPNQHGLFRKVETPGQTFGYIPQGIVSFSPCSQKLVVCCSPYFTYIWEFDREGSIQQSQEIKLLEGQKCSSAAFSSDSQRLAISFTGRTKDGFQVWKADGQGKFHREQEHLWLPYSQISCITFSPDCHKLAFQTNCAGV